MSKLLDRLGRSIARHHWRALAVWLLTGVAIVVGSRLSGAE